MGHIDPGAQCALPVAEFEGQVEVATQRSQVDPRQFAVEQAAPALHIAGLGQQRPGLRRDLLVAESLILELKAIDELHGIHEAQLLTYMKLSKINTGLLINFNIKKLVDGIGRFKLRNSLPSVLSVSSVVK